jgi:hypothetical protein
MKRKSTSTKIKSKKQKEYLRQLEADSEPSFERFSKCFLRVCRIET